MACRRTWGCSIGRGLHVSYSPRSSEVVLADLEEESFLDILSVPGRQRRRLTKRPTKRRMFGFGRYPMERDKNDACLSPGVMVHRPRQTLFVPARVTRRNRTAGPQERAGRGYVASAGEDHPRRASAH